MGHWNQNPVLLTEVQIGNLFYINNVRTVKTIGIHITGTLQVADNLSGEIISNVLLSDLKRIGLPAGGNIDLLEELLNNTEFEKIGREKFQYENKRNVIVLNRTILNWPLWVITHKLGGKVKSEYIIEYVHELQNHFTQMAGRRMTFAKQETHQL